MATAWVYSPAGGIITGRTYYCGCGICDGTGTLHGICKPGWTAPIDVDSNDNEEIYLYVNYPTVKSIRTLREYECCCNNANNFGRVIIVELYSETNGVGCFIGGVLYGHIANPAVSHNTIYNLSSSSKKLGTSPAGSWSCGGSSCYSGSHVHMERSGGTTVAPCCCVDTTKGSTKIYEYIFNTPCPSAPIP